MGFTDKCPAADRAGLSLPQESQVSQLSSVQLSPNQVREDYDFDTIDVLPMYTVSPRNDWDISQCIPHFVTLLSEPFIPLPEVILLKPAQAPVRPNSYPGCQPSPAPALSVNPPPPLLSHEGSFNAFTKPADTSDHPLISF